MVPSTGLPMNAEFGTFEDIPPRGDWDRHFDITGMGFGVKQGWLKIVGQAACGCVWELDIRSEGGFVTFRQMFDMFGSKFTFNGHTEDHALLCEEALPPDIFETTTVYFDTTVADILKQQP